MKAHDHLIPFLSSEVVWYEHCCFWGAAKHIHVCSMGLVSLAIDLSFQICFFLNVFLFDYEFSLYFWVFFSFLFFFFLVFFALLSFLGCLMLLNYFLVFRNLQIKTQSGGLRRWLLVKCLPHKQENLSSDPQHSLKKIRQGNIYPSSHC